ncbi:hypothetical protein BGZ73_005524 [Actinomortierella ambigua]|nr:hypothetical protein BGZ73_005524 [Actinomortierella ambigua]
MSSSDSNKRKRVDAVFDDPLVLQNPKRPSVLHPVQPPNETIFTEGSERELWLVEQLKLPRYHLPLRQVGSGSSSKKNRSPTDSSDALVPKAQVYKDLAAAFHKKRFKKPNGTDLFGTPESGNGIKTKVIELVKEFEEAQHTMATKTTRVDSNG